MSIKVMRAASVVAIAALLVMLYLLSTSRQDLAQDRRELAQARQELAQARQELAQFKKDVEERTKISAQVEAFLKSLPENNSDTCRAIVLASIGALERWKGEIPDSYRYAMTLLDKKDDSQEQTECRRNAESLRALIRGLVEMKRP